MQSASLSAAPEVSSTSSHADGGFPAHACLLWRRSRHPPALLSSTRRFPGRRQFLFGTVLAAALAVGVGAQSGGQSGQQDRGRTGTQLGQNKVVATGCLQR